MMRNPFGKHQQLSQEQVDTTYQEGGWGTKVERRVPRSDGEPLYFQIRLPNGVRCVEVADLAAAAQGAPAWLEGHAAALGEVAEHAGAVLVGALCPESDLTDVVATLTVALSPLTGPPEPSADSPDADNVVHHNVERISDTVTLDDLLTVETLAPGAEKCGVLLNQYLMSTPYGGMVMAFSSAHDGMVGSRGRNFFRQVFKTAWIGETPDPPPPS